MHTLSRWRSGSDFVGKMWPNGEFGLGFQKRVKMVHDVPEIESPFETPLSTKNLEYAKRQAERQQWCNQTGQSLPSLGLSPLSKSHKRNKRGLKGISSYGRKMIRNAAYLLQSQAGRSRLSFLTLTLPSVTFAESVTISKNWSEILRIFLQSLSRLLKSRSLPGEITGCTEIQESRTERDGVLGLHYHCVFVGRSVGKTWALHYLEIRNLWARTLQKYVSPGTDFSATENVERVKVDAEQYLGKYMSKGIKAMQSLIDKGWSDVLPAAWWNMSASLKHKVLKSVKVLMGDKADLIVRLVESEAPVFLYCKPVEIATSDGTPLKVGYFGKILREWLHCLYG